MKNKRKTFAYITLLVNFLLVITGFYFLQDAISKTENFNNIDSIKAIIREVGLTACFILLGQFSINLFLFYLIKKNQNSEDPKITTAVSKKEEKITPKESKSIEVDRNNNFSKIKDQVDQIDLKGLSLKTFGQKLFTVIAEEFELAQGILYVVESNSSNEKVLSYCAGYAYFKKENTTLRFGEGLAGQVAKAKRIINIKNIPEGYMKIISGLGEATPTNLIVCPVLNKRNTIAVFELASFNEFSKDDENNFLELSETLEKKIQQIKSHS